MSITSVIKKAALNTEAALNTAIDVVALRWDSRSLGKDELPSDLMAMRPQVLIFLLPRVFQSLDLTMASFFSSLWLFGKGRLGEIKQNHNLPGTPYYWSYRMSDFSNSPTLQTVAQSMLKNEILALRQLGLKSHAQDKRWTYLYKVAADMQKRHKGDKEWSESTLDYRNILVRPEVLLEIEKVIEETYIGFGEDPLKSDAFSAIGACGVRAYLWADISKRSGSETIYVWPKRVGVRIWDDYNFRDGNVVSHLNRITTIASQFLGIWVDAADGSHIVLQNADFDVFRSKFMPRYNAYLDHKRSKKGRLVCRDFSSISDYIDGEVGGGKEYPLVGLQGS